MTRPPAAVFAYIELRFDWPPVDLSPNARLHWRKKAAAVKVGRAMGLYEAKTWIERNGEIKLPPAIELDWTFTPPDHRKRDDDNMLAMMKSYRDGVFQAFGANDAAVVKTVINKAQPDAPGGVVLRIYQYEMPF
jgi:crossover junction endodeoxyribonuclease RusA